jgi:hypothetical protein
MPTSQIGTLKMAAEEEMEEVSGEKTVTLLSIVGFIAALVVLSLQLMTSNL